MHIKRGSKQDLIGNKFSILKKIFMENATFKTLYHNQISGNQVYFSTKQ